MDKNLTIIPRHFPVPQMMNNPFHYMPEPILVDIRDEVCAAVEAMSEWQRDVHKGKMFGFLVVEDEHGEMGYLKAYSGQICGRENWEGWVPAVCDYLAPDGYFKTRENEISSINQQIAELETSPRLAMACSVLKRKEKEMEKRIEEYRAFAADEKRRRKERRAVGEDEAALIAESQFQKAEMKRIKQAARCELQVYQNRVDALKEQIVSLRKQRKQLSDNLQVWLFGQFVMQNAEGDRKTLMEIFCDTPQRIPPSGAGECCAPKLLQYAFQHSLRPVMIAEFWYGESPKGEVRRHLDFYPACQGKCKPILDFMLRGMSLGVNPFDADGGADFVVGSLSVLYQDDDVIAVDKPSGMLSVPGKLTMPSAQELLQQTFGKERKVFAVHRLDMHTSGVLLFALSPDVQSALQRQFAERATRKEYVAVVERSAELDAADYYVGKRGVVSLPLSADYLNRPRQMVDYDNGKEAVTEYEVQGITESTLRLTLFPHHGRTHQLRVHCAHHDGLGMPIVGDMLYGHPAERLLLHARSLSIVNPINGKRYNFTAPCPF